MSQTVCTENILKLLLRKTQQYKAHYFENASYFLHNALLCFFCFVNLVTDTDKSFIRYNIRSRKALEVIRA